MKQVVGIQYLRAVASLAVVAFHLAPLLSPMGAQAEKEFLVALGSAGVDIFFVVSGFIIWQSTQGQSPPQGQWLLSRVIRVVPLYWISIGVAVVALYAATPEQAPPWLELVKSLLFIPYTGSVTGEMLPVFAPGWTLNYEMLFYALFAVALTWRHHAIRFLGISAFFVGLVLLRHFADPQSAVQFRLTSPLPLEFVAGMAIAIYHQHAERIKAKTAFGILAIATAAAFTSFLSSKMFPTGPRFIYFGVPAALLVFGVVNLEPQLRNYPVKWLKTIGDASYSLYLSHPHVIKLIFVPLGLSAPGNLIKSLSVGLFCVIACVLVAMAVYRAIEKPLLRIMRRHFIDGRGTKTLPVSAHASVAD